MAKFLISTSIPYVNDKPHLGHAMEFVLADVLARYHHQLGDSVLFSTGTDEHGGKILEAAKKAGQEPQQFVDAISVNFQQLCGELNVKFDQFVRTSEPRHVLVAQDLWQKIAGDITKGKYKGWYCTGSEEFVTKQEVDANKGVCPDHNRPYEEFEEDNYIFALSRYTKPITDLIKNDELLIRPTSRRNEILSVLESGLQDISISRPKAKIPWGVEVPGDPDQVMYVWVEALMNYLTVTGYPAAGYEQWWPTDVNIIGKDIIRFHGAIWPAILLSCGLPLPKAIYVHGFVNIGGKKMSKSLGNSVEPREVLQKYGTDAFRYYFLHEIPSDNDGDFGWDRMQAVYDSDLANELGNLVQRTAKMVSQYEQGIIGNLPKHSHDVKPYHEAISNFRFDKALDEVWLLVKGLNQYIEEEKPWKIAKDKEEFEHLTEVLSYLVANILQVSDLLVPFLPATAEKIQRTFAEGMVHPGVGVLFPRSDRPTKNAG